MTRVYFVRHAQPEHEWEEDRTRPLTEEGKKDSAIVLEFLKDKKKVIDVVCKIIDEVSFAGADSVMHGTIEKMAEH